MARKLYEIAKDIRKDWKGLRMAFGAIPYVEAMDCLSELTDKYALDSGREIVQRFLCNASTWRGEKAREIKAELNAMLKGK